jgi:23S rRNA (cytidine1920-2'-O)/16S rRNA (cytidine1409-2'-O)-methyltransferase
VVADLSFISLRSALPAMVPIAGVVAAFVLLVKPQFEVPRAEVGRDGVVRDIASWRRSMAGVSASAAELGLDARGAMASPLRGPAGNVEFFIYLVAGGAGAAQLSEGQLNAAVAEGSRIR